MASQSAGSTVMRSRTIQSTIYIDEEWSVARTLDLQYLYRRCISRWIDVRIDPGRNIWAADMPNMLSGVESGTVGMFSAIGSTEQSRRYLAMWCYQCFIRWSTGNMMKFISVHYCLDRTVWAANLPSAMQCELYSNEPLIPSIRHSIIKGRSGIMSYRNSTSV